MLADGFELGTIKENIGADADAAVVTAAAIAGMTTQRQKGNIEVINEAGSLQRKKKKEILVARNIDVDQVTQILEPPFRYCGLLSFFSIFIL